MTDDVEYNVGFSEKDICCISAEELMRGLAAHPHGFVVPGTIGQLHARQQELGVVNYRGMVLLHNFCFAEDGIPLLKRTVPAYSEGKSMVLVSVSGDHGGYILFILMLDNPASVADDAFRVMCEKVRKIADIYMAHRQLQTGAFFYLLSARMRSVYSMNQGNLCVPAFEHLFPISNVYYVHCPAEEEGGARCCCCCNCSCAALFIAWSLPSREFLSSSSNRGVFMCLGS